MKKRIVCTIFMLVNAFTSYANHCPQPDKVFQVDSNGQYTPIAPPGWHWSSWGTKKIVSSDIQFLYAKWAEQRMAADENNRVLCMYGNPDIMHYIGTLVTNEIIPKEQIEYLSNWTFRGILFECKSKSLDVMDCSF